MTRVAIHLMMGLLLLSSGVEAGARDRGPKYGPWVQLLASAPEPLRQSESPDYWALSPHYVGQSRESWCSAASLAMILNAVRAQIGTPTDSAERLLSQDALLSAVPDPAWVKAMKANQGYDLEPFAKTIEAALKAQGLKDFEVEVVPTPDRSSATLARLRRSLEENEQSAHDFIIANFVQGFVNGDQDPAALVGHYSPLGAYARNWQKGQDGVLVMEVDREYYEPFWVPVEKLLEGMATPKYPGDRTRGYLHIRFQNR
jgi:hypothetical protein